MCVAHAKILVKKLKFTLTKESDKTIYKEYLKIKRVIKKWNWDLRLWITIQD